MLQGAVGYQPVITTLPEGTNLVATAVISADRRYVRISAVPLFSSIGNITTFNFATGAQSVQSGSGGQLGQERSVNASRPVQETVELAARSRRVDAKIVVRRNGWIDIEIQTGVLAGLEQLVGDRAHHGVVGAESQGRDIEGDSARSAFGRESIFEQLRLAATSSADAEAANTGSLDRRRHRLTPPGNRSPPLESWPRCRPGLFPGVAGRTSVVDGF